MLLARTINHSHPAAANLLQNFVMTKAPVCVGHIRFYEYAFEYLTRRLTFGFKSLEQETVDTRSVIKLRYRSALWAFCKIADSARGGIRRFGCFVHQAAAASAPHKCRISSSTSAGFATV